MSRSRTARMVSAVVGCGVVVVTMTGCGGNGEAPGQAHQTVTVYAAASLTDSFTDLAREFEAEHAGATVELNFAGSSTLGTQLQEGAAADVFASADQANMDKAVDAGLVEGEPSIFATNTLTIAVPPGNPAGISGFQDLRGEGVSVVICESRVPCGAATDKIQEITGVSLTPVSEESAVTDVMGKVTSGQADAGVVYKTDVTAAGNAVEEIPIAQADQAVNKYPIAELASARNTELTQEFVDFVRGSRGQVRLAQEGFGAGF
ncbi:molybdate ABC transporter substrate-binding protein [Kocuria sp. ZOR0020]|uniref:molybdate ABC transporter substrate-binding protein n=1 Tax=Kocuria sp. ZOR0020 TaxID=1339234 RepID=UPI000647864E|nr:molybdate ABC transporter substrate-binding protein [Kocuria sp. ZOR0020]